jgi:REP element-mobilizing transposase RayT
MILAYHVVLGCYGFWLPNDPRGSWSENVWGKALQPFGEATKVNTRQSVAHRRHDTASRLAAKQHLKRPPVIFTDEQIQSVAAGFAIAAEVGEHTVYACAVMPDHAHFVIAQTKYPIEQAVRLFKQRATMQLLQKGLHPFSPSTKGAGETGTGEKRLSPIWAENFWKVFLNTDDEVRRAVKYVENNPVKEGRQLQCWDFVKSF